MASRVLVIGAAQEEQHKKHFAKALQWEVGG